MSEIIKDIHNSDIFGCIIETGCSVPVASKLLSVSGASRTVYMTECPYSKDYSNDKYNNQKVRAVSPEAIVGFLYHTKYSNLILENKINFVYAASFQVGNYNDISTHGWIGIRYKNTSKYYHISLHKSLSREDYIQQIGEIGLKLILARNEYVPNDCDVDIVLDENQKYDYLTTLKFISQNTNEQFSILSDDKIDRLESITRDSDTLILFKGSFNPVQNAHIEIINHCSKRFDSKPYFMISFNAIQKGHQPIEAVYFRIQLLLKLGYNVVICNKPYFKQNLDFLRNKFKKKVVFPMGLDTVNRLMWDYTETGIEQSYKDFDGVEIIVNNRKGCEVPEFLLQNNNLFSFVEDFSLVELSSTQVRNWIKEGNIEEVKKIVPAEIVEMIKKYYSENGK